MTPTSEGVVDNLVFIDGETNRHDLWRVLRFACLGKGGVTRLNIEVQLVDVNLFFMNKAGHQTVLRVYGYTASEVWLWVRKQGRCSSTSSHSYYFSFICGGRCLSHSQYLDRHRDEGRE